MSDDFSPAPPTGGFTPNPDAKSDSWQIAVVGTAGASVAIVGGKAVLLQLLNPNSGYTWPYLFLAAGLSAGLKVGLTIANPSWTTFSTTSPISPDDFDSFGSMKGVEFTPVIGGSLTFANIWSVDHAPNPLDLGGVQVGVSGGFDWTPGRFVLLKSLGSVASQATAFLDPDTIQSAAGNYFAANPVGKWMA